MPPILGTVQRLGGLRRLRQCRVRVGHRFEEPAIPGPERAVADGGPDLQKGAWFKTCHFQVTPEIDRALMATPFRVFFICCLAKQIGPILGYKQFCLGQTQGFFESIQRWRDAGCECDRFEAAPIYLSDQSLDIASVPVPNPSDASTYGTRSHSYVGAFEAHHQRRNLWNFLVLAPSRPGPARP